MTIGTMLFTKINTDSFSRADKKISDLQEQVASGKNDPRPSTDLVRASRLSVAKEQQALIERFQNNVTQVEMRLDQTDAALSEASNIMQRLKEIALRSASDSTNDEERDTLRIEVAQLRDNLVDIANAQDDSGGSLFGGFRRIDNPFRQGTNGIEYVGDRGRHTLRVSETANLQTGLDGASVFLSVQTQDGARSVFSVIDDLTYTLSGDATARTSKPQLGDITELEFSLGRKSQNVSFDLAGPSGTARLSIDLVQGVSGVMVDAINDVSAQTGITASLGPNGDTVMINAPGGAQMSNIQTDLESRAPLFKLQTLDNAGHPMGSPDFVVENRLSRDTLVSNLDDSLYHIADQRADAGALGQVAKRHANTLNDRHLIMEKARAGLEDLDLAKAVTELQTLLLTRDASQQTFVKISQRSLFDYLG